MITLPASTAVRHQVGVAVTTYDRIDDARCCLEILRSVWQPAPFPELTVVHAYSGPAGRYTPKLEDRLVRVGPSRSHYEGAAALLDAGLQALSEQSVRYAVAFTGDVWAYRPAWVASVIEEMATSELRLAAASWRIDPAAHGVIRASGPGLLPTDGLATDFLILDLPWAFKHRLLPLDYGLFIDSYADLLNYLQEMPFLERYVAGRFLSAVRTELQHQPGSKDPWGSAGPRRARQLLRLMHERRIDPDAKTAPAHEGHWPDIGLITTHNAQLKQQVVQAQPQLTGPTLERLRHSSSDLSWYDRSAAERLRRAAESRP